MRRQAVPALALAALTSLLAVAGAHGQSAGARPVDPGRKSLPATSHNVEVVGRLALKPAVLDRVADVAAHGHHAYLGAYSEPRCQRGGVYIVDIANPRRPRQVGFIRAAEDSFVGEGVQVLSLRTRFYRGDLLVHNNEICGRDKRARGGISLYDVTNPPRPRQLASGVGDRTLPDRPRTVRAHQTHSAFAWQDGGRAFVVMVDDEEALDVDIMEITNPRRPRVVSETDLNAFKVEQPNVNGQTSFLHDMTVKRVGGRQTLLASYWDGGYVQLDVDNPARPRLIRHTDFRAADPQRAARGHRIGAEGNAHQAEFDRTNRWFLAADEDFEPFRLFAQIATGPEAGRAIQFLQGAPDSPISTGQAKSEDEEDASRIGPARRRLSGATAFVGLACDPASVPRPAAVGAPIAVVERGVCLFTDKADAVAAAGYEGMVVFNRTGPEGGCDNELSGILDTKIPTLFVTRTEGFRILGLFDPATYRCTDTAEVPSDTQAPPIGTRGEGIGVRATFDGWGYVHMYDRRTAREIDSYALPASQRVRYATGYGDLSVHEVATDPDLDLAYVSYYAGGLRVLAFGPRGLREVGRYIGPRGNDFWGVEVLRRGPDGRKLVLASDRDSGLWIFRYTGPRP